MIKEENNTLLFNELKSKLEKRGYSVKSRPESLKDYAGMNPYAAKAFGIKMPDNEIWVDESDCTTLKHESDEMHLMEQGLSYWDAHGKALKLESSDTVYLPRDRNGKLPASSIKIVQVHDDGDLTLKINGVPHVVTTEGEAFKETQLAPDIKDAIQDMKNKSKDPVIARTRQSKHKPSSFPRYSPAPIGKLGNPRAVTGSGMTRRVRTGKVI
jgi:hypothetical protein